MQVNTNGMAWSGGYVSVIDNFERLITLKWTPQDEELNWQLSSTAPLVLCQTYFFLTFPRVLKLIDTHYYYEG